MALDRGYDVIGEMDADGSHQPEQLHRLLDALRDADLVIGSRWVPGGSIVNWPLHRQLLSRGGNFYTRTLLGIGVRDATAGFRLFRRTTLEQIALEEIASLGYVFQADLAFRALRAGLRVVEVPIEFVERERGDSKMSRRIATRVVPADHPVGARRAQPPGPGRAAWPTRHQRRRADTTADRTARNSRPLPDVDQDMSGARRRTFPGWLLVVAFIVVPLVEIYVIIQVGQVIGAWWTILLLIADSLLGSWLVKREGGRAWQALRTALDGGPDAPPRARRRHADPGRRRLHAHPRLRPRRRRDAVHPAVHPPDRSPDPVRRDQPQARRGRPSRRARGPAPVARAYRRLRRPTADTDQAPDRRA